MHDLAIWVINLDRAPERWARISAQLQELGLPYTRLSAMDARQMLPAQRDQLDQSTFQRRHGMTPTLGELGCYLSHVAAIKAFLASAAEVQFALVLEDDVLLLPSLPAVLQGLKAQRQLWDMVKLSAVHSGTPVAVADVAPDHSLAVMLSRCTGASAYLINRKAAQAYMSPSNGLLPMQLPYDHVYDQGWRFGLKVRLVTPTPCVHDEHIASTIALPPGPTRKFHWTRRLPAFAYRLGNESKRLAYGLTQLLHERLRR